MTPQEYEQSKLDELLKCFEPLRVTFCEATVAFLAEKVRVQAARIIETEANITATLSDDQLRELKRAMQMMIDDLPRAVGNWLNIDKYWWHKQDPLPSREPFGYQSGTRVYPNGIKTEASDKWGYCSIHDLRGRVLVPKFLDDLVRYLYAYAFLDFEQAGYLKNTTWRANQRYVGVLTWSEAMKNALGRYSVLQEKVWKIMDATAAIQTKATREVARQRWDSV